MEFGRANPFPLYCDRVRAVIFDGSLLLDPDGIYVECYVSGESIQMQPVGPLGDSVCDGPYEVLQPSFHAWFLLLVSYYHVLYDAIEAYVGIVSHRTGNFGPLFFFPADDAFSDHADTGLSV
jgi:hypothetical protein